MPFGNNGLIDGDMTIESILDYKNIKPYIAVFSRKSPDTDMKKLKNMGVIGTMIESGSLYDPIYTEREYRNPKLENQVSMAVKSDLPFAFYHEVRARSLIDAEKELLQLKLCIQKYQPVLGVWLRLLFKNSKDMNNKIIDKYKSYLENLGLKNKIGFYVTREELKKIDWQDKCNDWYLWLIDHVSDISDIECLLNPDFFMLKEI